MQFEWLFWAKKWPLYLMLAFYAALGLAVAMAAHFPFPETNKNSPYVNTYVIGLMSLVAIFSTTLMSAQSLFREQEARFDTILFAAPLRRLPYVTSRLLIIFLINTLCFALFTMSLMAGHQLANHSREAFGPLNVLYYLQPLLVLLLPNILFCTAVACCIGLTVRNKMFVYVSGVLIYFLYWGIAIFTDSPLIANAAPASAAALRRSALLDPFGIAAFLEQTRYWLPAERNTKLVQLKGHFLSNRILYLACSLVLLAIAYSRFRFTLAPQQQRSGKTGSQRPRAITFYTPAPVKTTGLCYTTAVLLTQLKTAWGGITGSPALWIAGTGWTGFLGIELFSATQGSSRVPPELATTAVMMKEIQSSLPTVGLLLLLFYAGESYRKSRDCRIAPIEDSTAASPGIKLLAHWFALTGIIMLLLLFSILTGIAIQHTRGYSIIDLKLYASLFYLTGLPLALSAALVLCLQLFTRNKHTGIALAGAVLLLLHTPVGNILLPAHPLARYGKAFDGAYSDMNGFGNALRAFGLQMSYNLGLCGIFLSLALLAERRRQRWSGAATGIRRFPAGGWLLVISIPLAGTGAAVLYQKVTAESSADRYDHQQAFEERYRFLKDKAQPVISRVQTAIDLYPSEERLMISGDYTLINPGKTGIDTLYVHISDQMECRSLSVPGAILSSRDSLNGYLLFALPQPMQPGDTLHLLFRLQYTASPFRKNDAANQILYNGTFSRISRYYPIPGYDVNSEIDNPRERTRRKMPERNNLLLLSDSRDTSTFVTMETLISTDSGQTAIAAGSLRKQWRRQGRNYFQYATEQPIPFRFAIASARYAVKRLLHRGIRVEAYYHPAHSRNIDHLMQVATQTLDYCTRHFGPYPGRSLTLAEISSFSRGFAGTAYPGCLFINESFGFKHQLDSQPGRDIINEMASHEIAHTWWGNAGIAPRYREGSTLLTEALAMYTELMLYKQMYGEAVLPERVNVHKDLYRAGRGMAHEVPLYRSAPEMAYLCYDKGMVVMYQLYKRLGEEKMNLALGRFYKDFAYPHAEPLSTDLLHALYQVADSSQRRKIDELLCEIVTYTFQINAAGLSHKAGQYVLQLNASARKFKEDGKGGQQEQNFGEPLEAAVYFEDGSRQTFLLWPENNKILGRYAFARKPEKIVLDPEGLFLDLSGEDKERRLQLLP